MKGKLIRILICIGCSAFCSSRSIALTELEIDSKAASTQTLNNKNQITFEEACKLNWAREEIQPTLSQWMDNSNSINLADLEFSIKSTEFSSIETRLLQQIATNVPDGKLRIKELQDLVMAQVSCKQAELTASGIPLLEKTYQILAKNSDYHILRRNSDSELAGAVSIEIANSITQSSSANQLPFWKSPKTWTVIAAGILVYAFFQSRYQIEY